MTVNPWKNCLGIFWGPSTSYQPHELNYGIHRGTRNGIELHDRGRRTARARGKEWCFVQHATARGDAWNNPPTSPHGLHSPPLTLEPAIYSELEHTELVEKNRHMHTKCLYGSLTQIHSYARTSFSFSQTQYRYVPLFYIYKSK